MAKDLAVQLVTSLELLNHNIFRVLLAGLAHHGFMEVGVEGFTLHPHRCHSQLLENIHKLFIETLITAMERLSLFALGIELLTGPIEIVHDR
jgi:hypothetical protein